MHNSTIFSTLIKLCTHCHSFKHFHHLLKKTSLEPPNQPPPNLPTPWPHPAVGNTSDVKYGKLRPKGLECAVSFQNRSLIQCVSSSKPWAPKSEICTCFQWISHSGLWLSFYRGRIHHGECFCEPHFWKNIKKELPETTSQRLQPHMVARDLAWPGDVRSGRSRENGAVFSHLRQPSWPWGQLWR